MERILLKSKIHRATVKRANKNYEGSITIDRDLMEAADLVPYEQVHIFNVTNGHRFYTYAIEGKRGSGLICINGAAAHLAGEGDTLIIASFSGYSQHEVNEHEPKLVYVDEKNKILRMKPEQKKLGIAKE